MQRSPAPAAVLVVLAACGPGSSAPLCEPAARVAALPDVLVEASGLTASRTRTGILWVHNDSDDQPRLYALGTDGALLQTLAVPEVNAPAADWEDIAAGACDADGGACLWIGDIGDNRHDRQDRVLLRVPEPAAGDTASAVPVRFPFAYPDAPADAEALFVLPGPQPWIITKGRTGPVAVYRYPLPLRPGERVTLEKVQELTEGLVQIPDMVTGAAATPGGDVVAIRTYGFLRLYRPVDGRLEPLGDALSLEGLDEFQGEGVALLADGTVFLASERGLERNEPPPLSRTTCRLN